MNASRRTMSALGRGTEAGILARWVPVALPAGVMAVMGFWGLSHGGSMTNDEAATRYAATYLSLPALARLLRHQDVVHGLYYLLIHVWSSLGPGNSPAALRVPSVLAMAVAVGLVVVLGRRLTGSLAAGLFAGLIVAVTPEVAHFAQNARSYAFVFAAAVAATLTLVVAVDDEVDVARRGHPERWWVLYGALVTVLGYLNELSLLLLAAHGITLLWARVERRVLDRWLTAAAVGAVLVAPLALVSLGQTGQVAWIQFPTWRSLTILWQGFFAASLPVAVLVFGCAVVGFVTWRRQPAGELRGDEGAATNLTLPLVAAPVAVVPTLLLIAASFVHPIYDIRYVIYGEAGVALLAGAGLVTLGRLVGKFRVPTWIPGIAVCLVALLSQLSTQRAHHLPNSAHGYGPLANYVAKQSEPRDGLLFLYPYYRKIELAYPAQFRNLQDFALAKTPAEIGNYKGQLLRFGAIKPRLLAHDRVWTITSAKRVARVKIHRAAAVSAREQRALLERRYRLMTSRRFDGVVVDLWRRN